VSSTFFGLEIAYSALRAQRQVMETAGHNIANVSTPGFTRQRVDLAAGRPFPIPSTNSTTGCFQLGSGVEAVRVTRIADLFVDSQLRTQSGKLAEKQDWQRSISQVEAVFQEPGEQGLGAVMAQFWNSWEQLTLNPESLVSRRSLVYQAQDLAETFNRMAGQLDAIQGNLDAEVVESASVINRLAQSIAELNQQISRAVSQDFTPNDLYDSRDRLVSELQEMVDLRLQNESDGQVSVYIGNRVLVQGSIANGVEAVVEPATGFNALRWAADGADVQVSSGKLAALHEMRDGYIPALEADMDDLASTMITSVNAFHAAGFDLNGDPVAGTAFENFFDGTSMATIAVSSSLVSDPAGIAAALSPNPGDAENARRIAGLATAKTMGGTYTFEDYYRSVVARTGIDVRAADNDVENAAILTEQITAWRESISGVSLDEEMVRLQEAQRAFEAAARVMNAMDDALEIIINLGLGR
jgi:flagellar hook-associated protein 1 FlgK